MSYIYLGNLTIKELENRTGFYFSDEDYMWLQKYRSDDASITYDSEKFHIFDVPFCIVCSELISEKVKSIFEKYEEQSRSKESLTIYSVKETDNEKNKKLQKQKEQEIKDDPNSVWNVKWHLLVPVFINNYLFKCYYKCFINTYTTGYENIPKFIDGTAYVELDDKGLHGKFNLKNPETDDDANKHPDWNHVVGLGFCKLNGDYIWNKPDATFNKVEFNIKEALKDYKDLFNEYREIHFYK